MQLKKRASLSLVAVVSLVSYASADVKPAPLFTDSAVLQRDVAIPVWGKASPGEKVTVSIFDQTAAGVTGEDGKWSVTLKPISAGGPFKMTIAGQNTLTLDNILVGDVWIASGQSNMEYGVTNSARDEAAKANDSQLRIFKLAKAAALTPIDTIEPSNDYDGKWEIATPEALARCGGWGGFSTVGYFFGREIRRFTKQPVGLIGTYWGGTTAQAWTSLDTLQKTPSLAHFAAKADAFAKTNPPDFPFAWRAFQAAHAKWEKDVGPEFLAKNQAWKDAAKAARAAHQPVPPQPKPPIREPSDLGYPDQPTVLFNGMIAPLLPYAIKGAIWYQGESNDDHAKEYRELFPAMIADWRAHWGQGDFPFLFVQIAPFKGLHPTIREAQLMTLTRSPNTAMAVTTDVGDADNIHPTNKLPVGHRLALAAEALAYGAKIEYSGPLFDKARYGNGNAVVSFTHIGSGLIAKNGDLKGFEIAGKDGKFVPAQATIKGDTVIAHAQGVPDPVAVRFSWANVPDVNLFNREGLPASPFRSDPD